MTEFAVSVQRRSWQTDLHGLTSNRWQGTYVDAVNRDIVTSSLDSCVCHICKQISAETIYSNLNAICKLVAYTTELTSKQGSTHDDLYVSWSSSADVAKQM